jgi:hypothetical protein
MCWRRVCHGGKRRTEVVFGHEEKAKRESLESEERRETCSGTVHRTVRCCYKHQVRGQHTNSEAGVWTAICGCGCSRVVRSKDPRTVAPVNCQWLADDSLVSGYTCVPKAHLINIHVDCAAV